MGYHRDIAEHFRRDFLLFGKAGFVVSLFIQAMVKELGGDVSNDSRASTISRQGFEFA